MILTIDSKNVRGAEQAEWINLIQGSNVTISARFAEPEKRLDITVTSTGGGGGLSDGDYGDITVSGGGTAMAVDAGAVAITELASIATDRLVGRDTAGSGAPEELTVGGGVEFTGSTGIQRSALTGDVTASAGSNATTIANDAVSDAKLRNSGALSVIGRSANSTGDPADISASTAGDYLAVKGTTLGFQAYQGTSFPSSPFNGQLFLRTDLDYVLFYWDAGRSAWLSVYTFELAFTNQTTVSAGSNLRLFQAPVTSGTIAYLTKWTCVLTEIVSHRVTSGSSTRLDLLDSVTNQKSHTIGSGATSATETGLNVAIASGALLNCQANTALTGGGWIIYTFRRSAT